MIRPLVTLVLMAVFGVEAWAQPYDPVAALTYVDLSIGSGIAAAYPSGANERVLAESEKGYGLIVSYFEPSRWSWHLGGRGGIWLSSDSYGSANWRSFSAYAGPVIAGVSPAMRASFDVSLGLLTAGSSANGSELLFSLGAAFSVHKYWLLGDSFGLGPGAHLMFPVLGQVSSEGPEWLLLSLSFTWAETH